MLVRCVAVVVGAEEIFSVFDVEVVGGEEGEGGRERVILLISHPYIPTSISFPLSLFSPFFSPSSVSSSYVQIPSLIHFFPVHLTFHVLSQTVTQSVGQSNPLPPFPLLLSPYQFSPHNFPSFLLDFMIFFTNFSSLLSGHGNPLLPFFLTHSSFPRLFSIP